MRRWLVRGSALLLAVGLSGCASGGASNVYRADMGRLLLGPLMETKERVWGLHQIPVYREQSDGTRVYIESMWMPREPTPAEEAQGVERAQNQIIIEGRRIEEGFDPSAAVYRVTFTLHNQTTTNLSSDWSGAPPPPQVVERYREVLRDMEIELRTGVRR